MRQALFLTLILILTLISHPCRSDSPFAPPVTEDDRQRINEVTSYIRQQSLQGMSVLPSEAHQMAMWFSGGWHSVPLSASDDEASPASALSDSSSSDSGPSMPLATNFHHKGFLPTHDAMVMGVGAGTNFLDNKLQVSARPFYGQSWSLQGYYGGEVTMNIAQRGDGMPWGKITAGYVSGNQNLTDHGRGIDLHGDVDLTHSTQFTTGIRQDNLSGDSNYVMLRWKMSFD